MTAFLVVSLLCLVLALGISVAERRARSLEQTRRIVGGIVEGFEGLR